MGKPDYYKILPISLADPLYSRAGIKSWKELKETNEDKIRGIAGVGFKGLRRLRTAKQVFGYADVLDEVEEGAWKCREGDIRKATNNKDRLICKCGEDKFIINKRRLEITCPICGEEYCFQGEVIEKWY